MKIKCPACSKVLTIPESAAGKIVKCPCGKQLRAPGNAAPPKSASGAARPGAATRTTAPTAPNRPSAAAAGEFDPAMFDELTDQDLKPVKGVGNAPKSSSTSGSSKLLNQYAPRGGAGGQSRREIAGVGSRILGAIIDALFVNVFSGIGVGVAFAILSAGGEEIGPSHLMGAIVIGTLASLIPLVVNGVLVAKSGQTVGKKLAGTKIVDQQTYATAGFVQGFLIRTIVFSFLAMIPFVALIDIGFLFSENHQTLHDKLAKTLVVKA